MTLNTFKDKKNNGVIYKLKCFSCKHIYIGQIHRTHDMNYNHDKSRYAKHTLRHKHQYSPIHDMLQILQVVYMKAIMGMRNVMY
jgi:hypothetical protein